MKQYYIISFHNTHHAIGAEKLLLNSKLPIQMIPVPKEISSGCGLALKISPNAIDDSISILLQQQIEIASCVLVVQEGLRKIISPYKKQLQD